jgi:hypothetical protein
MALRRDPAALSVAGVRRRTRAFVDGRRHLDDDGDDWRSLLFGAPPVRV